MKKNIVEQRDPGLSPLDKRLKDKRYLTSLLNNMKSPEEFKNWYKSNIEPFKRGGIRIPSGDILASQYTDKGRGRLNEWFTLGLISQVISIITTIESFCCRKGWFCCLPEGDLGGKRVQVRPDEPDATSTMNESKIMKIKNLKNIIKKEIKSLLENKSSINEKLSYYSEGHCYQEDGKRMPEAHCYEMMMKEIDKMPKGSKPMPFDPNDDRLKMKVTTPRRDGYSNVKKDRNLMPENKNKGCVSCNKKR